MLIPSQNLRVRAASYDNFELWIDSGIRFVNDLKFWGLRKLDQVLELGCGCGRIAVPLGIFLDVKGNYLGLDYRNDLIQWASDNISSVFFNVAFQYVDIYSPVYNTKGKIKAEDFSFPSNPNSYDVVIVDSLFNHFQAAGVANCLHEIKRVLKSKGWALCTFFCLNDIHKKNITESKSPLEFTYQVEEGVKRCYAQPDSAVAFEESTLIRMIDISGLELEHVEWGDWSDHGNLNFRQDYFYLSKL
jgi:SAM-dependent methyltransferase